MYLVLIYGFPVILVIMEMGLRFLFEIDVFGFIGPTLCAAAITTSIPTIQPRTQNVVGEDGKEYFVISPWDYQFVAFCWLVLIVLVMTWASVCYLSSEQPAAVSFGISTQLLIGIIAYIVGLVMVAVKDRLP